MLSFFLGLRREMFSLQQVLYIVSHARTYRHTHAERERERNSGSMHVCSQQRELMCVVVSVGREGSLCVCGHVCVCVLFRVCC